MHASRCKVLVPVDRCLLASDAWQAAAFRDRIEVYISWVTLFGNSLAPYVEERISEALNRLQWSVLADVPSLYGMKLADDWLWSLPRGMALRLASIILRTFEVFGFPVIWLKVILGGRDPGLALT